MGHNLNRHAFIIFAICWYILCQTNFGQTLYWDYYEFVKNNPIKKKKKKTYILYGNKDNLQDENIIKEFCNKTNCEISIFENGEHFFHTEEQLKSYKDWLDKVI